MNNKKAFFWHFGGAYRYGFNGKEKDPEGMGGGGSTYDYGFRIYNPQIAKFLSVDPLTKKFAMLTPYQFASNTPIWAVDLDGLEARIYSDLSALPHSFISVVDDEGVLNVYTFGQYGVGLKDGETSMYSDKSALVHLRGDAANDYIKHEFELYKDKMSVYEISDKKIDKQAIIDYYASEMKTYNVPAKSYREEVKLAYKYAGDGSKAVEYKPYWLTPDGCNNENCSSVVLDAMRAGGENNVANKYTGALALPWDINFGLWTRSLFSSDYNNVTQDAKQGAIDNANGNIGPVKADGTF